MRHLAGRSSIVFVTVFGVLLMLFVSQNSAIAQGADDPAQVDAGKAVYEMSCAGCHGADGTGVAGRGRPLTGIAGQGDRATHIASITDGKGGMPAFGDRLSGDEIDQAASYVRLTFVDAPATTDAPTELAITGVSTANLAIVGAVAVAAGAQLVVWSKRREN